MDAMNVVYLFSPHSIVNMKGAVVPTARLTPKLEPAAGGGDLSKKWKASGIWRHVSPLSNNEPSENSHQHGNHSENTCIHDMNLDQGLPMLVNTERVVDLEKIAPVRIELFFPRVYFYDPMDPFGENGEGDDEDENEDENENGYRRKVLQKVFCMVVVTPARNFSLTEYVRLYIVENSSVSSQVQENIMHRRELLQEILLDQIGMCEHLRQYMYFSSSNIQQKNPLDMLNVPSHDLFPGNYLCIQMAYRKIQTRLARMYGIDHHKIYVEGFSQTVNLLLQKDLQSVRQFNFDWHHSFYQSCTAFESLKVEERSEFKASLAESNAPW